MKILGHSSQQHFLAKAQSKNTLSHALLLVGPEAVGKRSLAHSLAGSILAPKDAPDKKQLDTLLASGNHPDLHIAGLNSEKRDLNVEDIRELLSKLKLKSYYGKGTVAIIDNAHRMNIAASNALLKTLEEPNDDSYLFLITHSPNLLPETIRSRCQQVHFGLLNDKECQEVLQSRFSEILAQDKTAALASICSGSLQILGTNAYLDQATLEITNSKALKKHIDDCLKQARHIDGMLDKVSKSGDPGVALSAASFLAEDKALQEQNWFSLIRYLRKTLRTTSDEKKRAKNAQILLEAIEAEQKTKRRNLNSHLQYSSLLLKTGA